MAQTKTKTPAAKKPTRNPAPTGTLFSVAVIWECGANTEAEVRVAGWKLPEALVIAASYNLLADSDYVAIAVPEPLPRRTPTPPDRLSGRSE